MATLEELAVIANNSGFQERVLSEAVSNALYHLSVDPPVAANVLLAQRILDGDEPMKFWAHAVLRDEGNIQAGAWDPDGGNIPDSGTNSIASRVLTLWNAFAV